MGKGERQGEVNGGCVEISEHVGRCGRRGSGIDLGHTLSPPSTTLGPGLSVCPDPGPDCGVGSLEESPAATPGFSVGKQDVPACLLGRFRTGLEDLSKKGPSTRGP